MRPASDGIAATVARPRWVRLPEEARLRGFSTEGLRRWCEARGVSVRQSSHRDAWVSPEAIDAAVDALPIAKRAAPADSDGIAAELKALAGWKR